MAVPRRSAESGQAAPHTAAFLSFLVPGLGQLWLGGIRRGLLIAVPALALPIAALLLVIVGDKGLRGLAEALLQPGVLVALLVLNVALTLYHLAAISDAFRFARRRLAAAAPTGPSRPHRRPFSIVLVALLLVTLGVHGTIEVVGIQAYQTEGQVFGDPNTGWGIPSPSFAPSPSPSATPSHSPGTTPGTPVPATPSPTPLPAWAQDGRLNLLLIGTDAGPGRTLARTDTMVVLSVDIATGRAALFSIPRNVYNVPLAPEDAAAFPDGIFPYPYLLNSLYVYAINHPKLFPGGDARGFRAVTGAIQELIGQPLDGAVVVNLNGFVDLVDAIGGLWVNVPYEVVDDHYPTPDGLGYIHIDVKPGCQKMDGLRALEYARSRHQDSDYGRMERQQIVLLAFAKQVDPLALLGQVPHLLDVAKDNLFTTLSPAEIPALAELASKVDTAHVTRVLLVPPTYPEYFTKSTVARIRKVVANVFDKPLPTLKPSATPSPTPKTCPKS
jgi:LCP family protein required for cell wall assembly